MTFPSGKTYVGEFYFGQMSGQGLMTWKSGKTYQGAFFMGYKCGEGGEDGHGILAEPLKALPKEETDEQVVDKVYDGNFFKDEKTGIAKQTRTYENGAKQVYEGNFLNGEFHGKGKLEYHNDDKEKRAGWDGFWKDGEHLKLSDETKVEKTSWSELKADTKADDYKKSEWYTKLGGDDQELVDLLRAKQDAQDKDAEGSDDELKP